MSIQLGILSFQSFPYEWFSYMFTAVDIEQKRVDVRDFGAVIDGETADNEAIQDAIDYAHEQNIPIVFLPAGTYHFDDEIRMKSNIHIKGEGEFETILQGLTGGQDKHYISLEPTSGSQLEHVTLSHFQIYATDSGHPRHGQIYQDNAETISHLLIEHVRIVSEEGGEGGISFYNIDGHNEHVHIRQCSIILAEAEISNNYCIHIQKRTNSLWVTDCYLEQVAESFNSLAVYADCNDFHIIGNTIQTCGHSAIAMSPAHKGEVIGNIVRNVETTNEAGIEMEWRGSHSGIETSHDIVVSGNITDNCYYGIFTNIINDTSVDGDSPYNLLIHGNMTSNSIARGINIDQGEFIHVTGNQRFNDENGIRISPDVGPGSAITNNSITSDGNNGGNIGITISGSNRFISGNLIYQFSTSYFLGNQAENGFYFGNQILESGSLTNNGSNNTFWNTEGIQFDSSNQSLFSFFEETTESLDFSGPINSTSKTVTIQRKGTTIILDIPELFETGNDTSASITSSPLSSRFRPSIHVHFPIIVENNGSKTSGTLVAQSNGELLIFVQQNSNFDSSSSTHGFPRPGNISFVPTLN